MDSDYITIPAAGLSGSITTSRAKAAPLTRWRVICRENRPQDANSINVDPYRSVEFFAADAEKASLAAEHTGLAVIAVTTWS